MPKHFLAVCLCIVALSGCQSTNQSSIPAQESNRTDTSRSTTDNKNGPDDASRRSYASIQDRNDRNLLQQAATALKAGDASLAMALLHTLATPPANADLAGSYHRLLASTKLRLGDALGAGRALADIRGPQKQDLPLIQEICAELGAISCILETKVMSQLLSGRYVQKFQDQVWVALQENSSKPTSKTRLNLETARSLSTVAKQIPHFQNSAEEISNTSLLWLDLYRTVTGAGSVPMAQNAWRNWQQNNTRHPAAQLPPTPVQRLENYRAPQISVMLPLSGRLTPVGNAIRNGFVTGYLEDLSPVEPKPTSAAEITFFDSNQYDDLALVTLSEELRSDVIIGPLVKDRALGVLNVLSDYRSNKTVASRVPSVVLLNRVRSVETSAATGLNVYQFAAAIEDEALTLAENLKSLGHTRLMVVSNGEPWAERAKQALFAHWQGPIVEANFQQTKDLTHAVGDAMGVSDSQQRREQMAKLLDEELEFLPRERKDLEAIVAFIDGLQSKALVPALRFHFADELPVFATSQTARSHDLDELANFRIAELPLLANPDTVAKSMTATFDLKDNPFIEFFALGLDAYRLATWTHWLNENSQALGDQQPLTLSLASGTLTLGQQGAIRRRLDIAVIDRRGALRPTTGNSR
jgi:outer membrane PBP1 activator LpoA protein